MEFQMTLRERIRNGLLGKETDKVPLHCRKRMAPLTDEYRWARDLGWGVLDNHPGFKMHYDGCEISKENTSIDGRISKRRKICLPHASLSSALTADPSGGKAIAEHLFKSSKDYDALKTYFESIRYEPAYDEFRQRDKNAGDNGYIYSWLGYDPMHEIMVKTMGIETFCFEWMDNRDEILELYNILLEKHKQMFKIVAEGPAEIVVYGGNIQPTIVSPAQFETFYLPVYKECGKLMHQNDKKLGAHLDDAVGPLLEVMTQCPWDIAEAFAVSPDGNMSIAQARKAWPNRVLSINFPSAYHHADENTIRAATRQYIKDANSNKGLLISLTEEFPKEAEQKLFTCIAEVVDEMTNV
jgi:Uroporphyrinogen decarboxylase (URO-D)